MKMKLHWQIIIGLVAGALFGVFAAVNQLSATTGSHPSVPYSLIY